MKSYVRHILLLLSCLYFSVFPSAQFIGTKAFPIGVDGSSSKILTLKKNTNGYLLAGTTNGLYRFNGREFSSINFKDSIKSSAVSAVHEDNTGKVWVGMQTGEIGFINQGKIQLLNAEEGHPKVAITSILSDEKGTLFFATAGEGIYYYLNNRFYNINVDDGLSDNYVYDIRITPGSTLIATTDKGINLCKIEDGKKKISSYTSSNGLPDNITRTISPYQKDSYMIGMQDKGVGLFDIAKVVFQFLPGLSEWIWGQVNSLLNIDEKLLIATEDHGVISLDDSRPSAISFDDNKTYNKSNHLLKDDEGNIWFSSNNELIKTSGTQLQNIIPYEANLYNQIHTILSDKKGNIWVNYKGGLKMFTKGGNGWKGKDYPLPSINSKNDITSMYEDKFGDLWIGTMGRGIIILNPLTGQSRLINDDAIVNASILSIGGRDDQVWISSLGGAIVCRLNNNNSDIRGRYSFENFSELSGIGSNYIYSIVVDSRKRVWFATDGRGLTLYENGKFINYAEKNGIKSRVIYSLCEDKKGNIWFSTLNGGIYKFDGKTFTNLSVEDGLNDATITSLAVDRSGNIIAVSKKGINVINASTNSISYFDEAQGLTELNSDLNCVATSPNRDLLFSTASGIVNYSPSFTSLQPKIILENVQLFLNDIDITQKQDFAHDENNISFNFTGISLSHPDKVQYQYQLEGFSNQWISTKDNSINFPRLPPGKYTFKVRVSINNDFSNSEQASFQFTIGKPFWLQWWFIITALLLLTGLFYWYIKTREKRVQRWSRLEKERIQSQFETLKSQVNPHFLFNSFNTLISVIEENPQSAVDYVEHLSDLYRKIVTYRDKNLISLKEEIELINDYFFIQKKRFGTNLQLNIKLSAEEQAIYSIAPLTLQLLAENAVKHNAISAETPLTIEVLILEKMLIVRNNINRKMTAEKGAGMGLQNIRNRYKLLNTEEIKIEKTEDTFVVYIPLIKEKQ